MAFWEVAGGVGAAVVLGGGYLWVKHDKKKNAESLMSEARERGWGYQRRSQGSPSAFERAWFMVNSTAGGLHETQHVLTGTHRGYAFEASEKTSRYEQNIERVTQRVKITTPYHNSVLEVTQKLSSTVGKAMDVIGDLGTKRPPEISVPNANFSNMFRVCSDDQVFANALLSDEVQARLMKDEAGGLVPIWFNNSEVVTESKGNLSIEDVSKKLDNLADLLDMVPPHAWSGANAQ